MDPTRTLAQSSHAGASFRRSRYCRTGSRKPSLLVTVVPPGHQDEIPARRAAHLPYVIHVHQAGAADAQHRLRAGRTSPPAAGAARVEAVAADGEAHIVAVRLDHLHLRHVQHVHAAAEFGQQARLALGAGARPALELRQQPGQRAWRS